MKNWFEEIRFKQRKSLQIGAVILVIIIIGIIWDTASATGKNNINNYYNTENNYYETQNITSGVSDSELAEGLSLAMSMNHPFDYNTLKWQGSITGAYYDDENAVSFGLAKRFEKMDALWHIEAGQNGSEEAFVGGVVFRF